MSKTTIYKIDKKEKKNDLVSLIVEIVIYAIVLIISSNLFNNFYIDNALWSLIAAIVLSVLNYYIKPFLIFLTLPLTIVTFGIAYPIVNMIILKLCDIILGSKFVINGFFSLFFIAIFISFLKIILDRFIGNSMKGSN